MSNIENAIEILKENGFQKEADELALLAIDLYSSDKEKILKAADKISGVCILRAWGDLNITTMNGWKWNALLDKINGTAKTQANKTNE